MAAELSGDICASARATPAKRSRSQLDADLRRQRYGYDYVFSRQVEAFAQPGDVVVGLTTSGTSRNVVHALQAAKKKGAVAIAFTVTAAARSRTLPIWSCSVRRLRRDRSGGSSGHGAHRLRLVEQRIIFGK